MDPAGPHGQAVPGHMLVELRWRYAGRDRVRRILVATAAVVGGNRGRSNRSGGEVLHPRTQVGGVVCRF